MIYRIALMAVFLGVIAGAQQRGLREVNDVPSPKGSSLIAITKATLIDGRGGPAIENATVLIRGERIAAVGTKIPIPPGSEVFDAAGLSVLPGLIDAHFHIDDDATLPALFLQHGITSVRDPGQWIEAYDEPRKSGAPIPRLFLAGPHLDQPPPAYPKDSILVRDAEETRLAVNSAIDQGASVIKVYFRLPLGLIRVAAETAHARGVPVTAHLEIVDAADAIRAGIDGIEHITSFGTSLMPRREAEKYRQAMLADNNARREGRYRVWNDLDLQSPRVASVLELVAKRGVFLSPTLAVFERRAGDRDTNETHVRGFKNMLAFTGLAKRAGARVVVGSHSSVPHAERGWAYQREMELLVEAGFPPMQAIVAATLENARFFRIADRLGTLEPGKIADLLLVEGRPDQDITAMRKVKRVMLNGEWQ